MDFTIFLSFNTNTQYQINDLIIKYFIFYFCNFCIDLSNLTITKNMFNAH